MFKHHTIYGNNFKNIPELKKIDRQTISGCTKAWNYFGLVDDNIDCSNYEDCDVYYEYDNFRFIVISQSMFNVENCFGWSIAIVDETRLSAKNMDRMFQLATKTQKKIDARIREENKLVRNAERECLRSDIAYG